MSVKTLYVDPESSIISPIAMPVTFLLIGTPASIRAREAEEVEAIEEDPLEERISETTLIV